MESATAMAEQGEASQNQDQRSLGRALIVESDNSDRQLLEVMLSNDGWQVECAAEGILAWNLINQVEPTNLVILNLVLPGINGFRLIERLRNHKRWGPVPIIALCSGVGKEGVLQARSYGVSAFFAKPYDAVRLMKEVQRVIAPAAETTAS